jgi:uncharacterized membrane protein
MRQTMKNISDVNLFITTSTLALIASWVITELFSTSSIRSLIFTHVTLGGLAFLIGGITLFSKKGSPLHKLTGRIFYISMVVSVSITLVVSMLPNHVSPTMFHIGVLSLYFLIGGKRSITFKNPKHNLFIDKLLAYIVILVSLIIMSYSVVLDGNFHPLRTVFGSIGIVFGLLDIKLFSHPQNIKKKWLFLHLSKMLGGYTAAVTAFFVAQKILTGYFNWFLPTVIGLSYIGFWMFKLKTFRQTLVSIINTKN